MKTKKKDILILLAISAAVLLANLWGGSLASWDEAFYAQVSREMLKSNNWIDLTWGGAPWSDKPPLYMWGTAVFYKLFGINEFSARLFSALSGMALVALTYVFASKLFSRRTGFLSGIMLISTYHFMWFGRMGTLDMTFTLFTLLSIYSFLTADERPAGVLWSFVWFSLAFLTKGIGAVLIPAVLGLYVLFARRFDLVFNRWTAFGIVAFLVITGSWYITAYMHYGQDFLRGHFLQHMVTRTTGAMDGHTGNWLTYINVVLYKGKPWGTLGLIAFPFFAGYAIRRRETRYYILISWILVVFLLFSAVKTKLHWYIIPVYPAVIMVAAWTADKLLRRSAAGVVAAVAVVGIVYFGTSKDVFVQDYNPRIKAFARIVEEKAKGRDVYLYDVGDPAMKFYFGRFARNVYSDNAAAVLSGKKGTVIVTSPAAADSLGLKGRVVPSGREDLTAVIVG